MRVANTDSTSLRQASHLPPLEKKKVKNRQMQQTWLAGATLAECGSTIGFFWEAAAAISPWRFYPFIIIGKSWLYICGHLEKACQVPLSTFHVSATKPFFDDGCRRFSFAFALAGTKTIRHIKYPTIQMLLPNSCALLTHIISISQLLSSFVVVFFLKPSMTNMLKRCG